MWAGPISTLPSASEGNTESRRLVPSVERRQDEMIRLARALANAGFGLDHLICLRGRDPRRLVRVSEREQTGGTDSNEKRPTADNDPVGRGDELVAANAMKVHVDLRIEH